MKVMAIDFGQKRMGFAVGNAEVKTITPLEILHRKTMEYDLKHIRQIIGEYDVRRIVIGDPLQKDGSSGSLSEKIHEFGRFLRSRLQVEVIYLDERLSSFEADEILRPQVTRLKKRKEIRDSLAASVILRDYFNQP